MHAQDLDPQPSTEREVAGNASEHIHYLMDIDHISDQLQCVGLGCQSW